MDLQGRTAVVTGSAIRVGRQICLGLASRGARIVINYRSSAGAAAELVEEIRRMGTDAIAIQGDVSRSEDVARIASGAEQAFGKVQVLVNNASIYPRTPLAQLTAAQWDESIAVNLKGPFLCCLEFGRRMAEGDGGAIVNISDWAVFHPYPDYLPYLTAKGGIIAMSRAFARELAPNVRVNCIAPGPIQPPDSLSEYEQHEAAAGTLVGRWGSPQDIASAVAFLIEGSDFITGVVLPVDGGRMIA
ncbi:MAG: SDR family oxidoreductase [Chloroflexi bacterium]|nr:SDR family oxidoreductase [Chloroflexota bacterium]